jgi:hypothetical protein
MNRALTSNAEFSFEMNPDLTFDAETNSMLDDTDLLLEIRKGNVSQDNKKKNDGKTKSSPRITRKLRFLDNVVEDMDTN